MLGKLNISSRRLQMSRATNKRQWQPLHVYMYVYMWVYMYVGVHVSMTLTNWSTDCGVYILATLLFDG